MKNLNILPVILLVTALASPAVGDTIPRGAIIEDGVTIHLTEDVINFIGDEFEEYIYSDFEDLMREQLPIEIFDEGCIWVYNAFITRIAYINMGWPVLTVDATRPYLNFTFHVSNFHMDFLLWGEGAFCLDEYDCNSDIYFNNLDGTAQAYFIVEGTNIKTIMTEANVNMSGYEFDTEGECFIIEIIAEILESTIEDMFEEFMEEYMLYDLPQIVDDALVNLSLEDTFSLLGHDLDYSIAPAEIPIDNDGATMSMDGVATADPDQLCVPYFPGSLYTPSEPPDYGTEVPGMPGQDYDIAFSVSDDLANQALFAYFDTGGFCLMLDQYSLEKYGIDFDLTTTDLQLFLPELYEIAPDARFSLAMNPKEAPYVTVGTGSGFLEGQLNVVIPHVDLDGYIELYGRNVRAFSCATSMDIELLLYITDQNTVRLVISAAPDITAELAWEGLVDLNDEIFEVVAPFLLEIILPVVSLLLPEVDMPVIEGYTFELIAFVPDGPAVDYISAYGNLLEAMPKSGPERIYRHSRELSSR